MSSIITEEYLEASERMRARVNRGVDINSGAEELDLDPSLVSALFERYKVENKHDQLSRTFFVVGIGLVPMNLDDMLALKGKYSKNDYLHLELIEHSERITDRTLLDLGNKGGDAIKIMNDRIAGDFGLMYLDIWGNKAQKCISMPFKIFRSKMAVEIKGKYLN